MRNKITPRRPRIPSTCGNPPFLSPGIWVQVHTPLSSPTFCLLMVQLSILIVTKINVMPIIIFITRISIFWKRYNFQKYVHFAKILWKINFFLLKEKSLLKQPHFLIKSFCKEQEINNCYFKIFANIFWNAVMNASLWFIVLTYWFSIIIRKIKSFIHQPLGYMMYWATFARYRMNGGRNLNFFLALNQERQTLKPFKHMAIFC